MRDFWFVIARIKLSKIAILRGKHRATSCEQLRGLGQTAEGLTMSGSSAIGNIVNSKSPPQRTIFKRT